MLEFVDTFRKRYFPEVPNQHEDQNQPFARVMPLALEGLFLTMSSTQTRMGRHVAARVDEEFKQWLFEVGIPRNTRLSEMALKAKPTVIYDRRSKGSRAYFDLADELVRRFLANNKSPEDSATDTLPTPGETPPEIAQNDNLSGLEGLNRFLAELGGAPTSTPEIPISEEPAEPEMVSLDDLLAEEENQSHSSRKMWDDWDQDYNGDDPDSNHRLN